MDKFKRLEIGENLTFVTCKGFQLGLADDNGDDKMHQFGIMFETIDMADAAGEKEYDQYPIVVSAEIMVLKCHKSFNESAQKPTVDGLLYDAKSYMGGVPIDHILTHAIRNSAEKIKSSFESLVSQFTPNEACVITQKAQFGTVAAQKGPDHEFKYLQFKTFDAAEKYIEFLIENRINALGMMIGFILDKPINMIGDSGWSVIENQVNGCKSNRKVGAQ